MRLQILETPGHTPEGISILVYDLAHQAAGPYAVLTGDTLFVGDVGRPDLLASIGVTADELADMLYDSLTNKLCSFPTRRSFIRPTGPARCAERTEQRDGIHDRRADEIQLRRATHEPRRSSKR